MTGEALQLRRDIALADGGTVQSVWGVPRSYAAGARTALVLAHGAGSDLDAPLLRYLNRALAERGILCLRFNFPYRERGAKLPDRAPVLEQTWRTVIQHLRGDPQYSPERLFVGGHSMGGRMASRVAAADGGSDGLVLLGYPLHPARKPDRIRTQHFPELRCPCLFIQGDRDALCDLSLLRPALQTVPGPVRLHVIPGADHAFQVLKRLGRSEPDVRSEIAQVIAAWIADPAGG